MGLFSDLKTTGVQGLTSKGVMRIVNAINSPWLSVTLDTGNFFDNREEQLAELAPTHA